MTSKKRQYAYSNDAQDWAYYVTKDQVKKVLDRVLTWPQSRQEDAARILSEMEQYDASSYRLTDGQVAEVKRRLADPNPKFLTLEEVRERFAQRAHEGHHPRGGQASIDALRAGKRRSSSSQRCSCIGPANY